jgi:hypothetical protein
MSDLATLVQTFGWPMALFIVMTVSGASGVWVWGWQYRAVEKQRDEWKDIALKGQISSERMLELLDRRGTR